jgi:hypothetical protein
MRSFLFIVLLIVACAMFFPAAPARADQPGTNEDPFGGNAIIVFNPEGGEGIVAKFGNYPGEAQPGGIPSRKSGDGTSPRRAININGIWGQSGDPTPELVNCATLKIPAGNYRWFKLEAYGDRQVHIWVDDEITEATTASGGSTWGAADQYMLGTAPGTRWQTNALDNSQTENHLEGFVMAVYGPDNLNPMGAFSPPNAALLSVNVDGRGKLLNGPDNVSVIDATGAGIQGFGSHNWGEPKHLLWYDGRFAGWVFVSIYNQMIWDGTASVCSQRVY